ncbi:pantothenate kinase [Bengtsoniella intestinalis]|uniref:pantothenate kinase n=1 Tax=Bengtsoniella intestinalis TaxID=3073143 RepID=UPI00391F51B0
MTYLGLDAGTTATKWALVDHDGGLLDTGILTEDILPLCQRLHPTAVGITGVGASKLPPLPCPTTMVCEFDAVGKGALALSDKSEAVVVSLGTGTAFLHAKADGTIAHICGTGIGGGTIAGLCQVMAGTTGHQDVAKRAIDGTFTHVDLTMAEVTDQLPEGLLPDMTAANFARIRPDATPADYVSGGINLVLHAVGTMALMGCKITGCNQVIFVGASTQLPPVQAVLDLFTLCYGIPYETVDNAAYATAFGAGLMVKGA